MKEKEADKTRGLYEKYRIEKADGTPVDPEAKYFVLRYDNSYAGLTALLTYANCIRDLNPQLADDLFKEAIEAGNKILLIAKEDDQATPKIVSDE